MKDYHDLYLKCDVSLLTDMLEKPRNNSLKIYRSSHYLRTPGMQCSILFRMNVFGAFHRWRVLKKPPP